eukprot:gene36458-44967_t
MATAKKAPAKTAAADKAAAPAKKRTPNAAFMKALTPSPALAAVVGAAPLPRTEIISKLWVYIKANNLQDATNKRNINADAKLKELFGKPQVSMFELAGLIGKHQKAGFAGFLLLGHINPNLANLGARSKAQCVTADNAVAGCAAVFFQLVSHT